MTAFRFLHLDVFTGEPFEGNPLAVFPDGRGLTDRLMQRIAREMACPETTFVLPADAAGTDARVRIFTPRAECRWPGIPPSAPRSPWRMTASSRAARLAWCSARAWVRSRSTWS